MPPVRAAVPRRTLDTPERSARHSRSAPATASLLPRQPPTPSIGAQRPKITTGYSEYLRLIDTPPGYIGDIDDPTLSELDRITTRCRTACEREYAGNPHVAANCQASGAFETPYLVEVPHTSTRRTIADAEIAGGGLYEEQSLTCSLLDDCCSAFDEDVCPAAPWRLTTAQSQLHRGEEYLLSMSGELKLYSVDDDIYEDAAAIGTIGYANCAGGNANAPCPLYIGSAHAETIETLAIEVDCDGTPFPLAMELITIDLTQPAIGINAEDSEEGGFPPGALVLQTHAEAGPLEFDAIEVNTAPVYAPASGGWAQVLANGGTKTTLKVDCGPEVKTFEAWFDLDADAALEQPPLVAIDMPSTVTCNTPVTLDADVADPDGDDDTLRWEVDGVLLAPSMTTLQVTGAHAIRAIVQDDRGATTTDVHAITCS